MLLQVPDILNEEEIAQIKEILGKSSWLENDANNIKSVEASEEIAALSDSILKALEKSALFISSALPSKISPPFFYKIDEKFQDEPQVDSAIKYLQGGAFRLRCDLNATLFLSNPNDYQGGELVVEDSFGLHRIKLPAGQLIIYPASAIHYISKITSGENLAINFSIESMVKENDKRAILFEIDSSIRALNNDDCKNPVIRHLANSYHNLVRMWADS